MKGDFRRRKQRQGSKAAARERDVITLWIRSSGSLKQTLCSVTGVVDPVDADPDPKSSMLDPETLLCHRSWITVSYVRGNTPTFFTAPCFKMQALRSGLTWPGRRGTASGAWWSPPASTSMTGRRGSSATRNNVRRNGTVSRESVPLRKRADRCHFYSVCGMPEKMSRPRPGSSDPSTAAR